MQTKLIKDGCALEIVNVKIEDLNLEQKQTIKELLFEYGIIVLRKQTLCPAEYTRFVNDIGPIHEFDELVWNQYGEWTGKLTSLPNPATFEPKDQYPVQRVTGQKINDKFTGIFATGTLDWHSDMNRYDIGDGTALQGYTGCKNTSTLILSTNKAYRELPKDVANDIKETYCEYTFNPDKWANGIPEHQRQIMLDSPSGTRKHYKMWLEQTNAGGYKGFYFFPNNKCLMRTKNGIDHNIRTKFEDYLLQEEFMYEHWWEEGDILLMDQLTTLHRRGQNDPEIISNRILHRICFRLSNLNNYVEKNNTIKIENPALSAPVIAAPTTLDNDYIFGFDFDFDKQKLLQQYKKNLQNSKNFNDNGLPVSVPKLQLQEDFEFNYAQELMDFFEITGEAKYYTVKKDCDFDLHVDTLPQCSINVLVSDNPAPVFIGGKNYMYKNCVLNVKEPHGVFMNDETRILFKISIFDYTFEEVKQKINTKLKDLK